MTRSAYNKTRFKRPVGAWLRRILPACAGLLILTGCVSMPERRAISVDQTTPEFQAARAREVERLESEGVRPRDRAARATENIIASFKKAEVERRLTLVAPLVQALVDFQRPRGCWAYTVTTKTTSQQGDSTIEVELFDPSEPMETAWTLVSRNGIPLDQEALADYRREKLREWKRELRKEPDRRSLAERVQSWARRDEFRIETAEDDCSTFVFETPETSAPWLGRIGGMRHGFIVDLTTGKLQSRATLSLGPSTILAGSMRVAHWEIRTEYATVDPALPPFPATERRHFQVSLRGREHEAVTERVYSDYRRVTCYDERFQIKMPEPEMLEFVPSFN